MLRTRQPRGHRLHGFRRSKELHRLPAGPSPRRKGLCDADVHLPCLKLGPPEACIWKALSLWTTLSINIMYSRLVQDPMDRGAWQATVREIAKSGTRLNGWATATEALLHVRFLLFSCSSLFATPWMQHSRLPCPSPSPGVCSNSCPLNRWCHPTISSSCVIPFSSCLQSFPATASFPLTMIKDFSPIPFSFSTDGRNSDSSSSESGSQTS